MRGQKCEWSVFTWPSSWPHVITQKSLPCGFAWKGERGCSWLAVVSLVVLYCIVSIHLYSASCSAHQSEALLVRETQREESSLERTQKRLPCGFAWKRERGCGWLSSLWLCLLSSVMWLSHKQKSCANEYLVPGQLLCWDFILLVGYQWRSQIGWSAKGLNIKADLMQTAMKRKLGLFGHIWPLWPKPGLCRIFDILSATYTFQYKYNWAFISRFNKNKSCTRACLASSGWSHRQAKAALNRQASSQRTPSQTRYRTEDKRKLKSVMLEIMNGKGRCGRPNKEWIDDIKEWCKTDLYSVTISARDRGAIVAL